MKNLLRKITTSLLLCLIATVSLLTTNTALANDVGDPAITQFAMMPTKPAPKSEVDFIVAYQNQGAGEATNVTLVVDFEENIFKRILVGNSKECVNTGITVVCHFNSIPSGATGSIGFTGHIAENAVMRKKVITEATIMEAGNPLDKTTNNFKNFTVAIGEEVKSSLSGAGATKLGVVTNAELLKTKEDLKKPSSKQDVSLFDVASNPNWQVSSLNTVGLKFMIRGKEALAWSLGIKDSGFRNPAIRASYSKVLTIVNSLFVIGLLVIAGMWMFSILIPRKVLRKVILIYGMAIVFVNFALPANQLLIDGSSLIQNTFMSGVDITSIVQTPTYNDSTAIGYENTANIVSQSSGKKLKLDFSANNTNDTSDDIPIGSIGQGITSLQKPNYIGTIMYPIVDDEGNVLSVKEETVQLRSTSDSVLSINPNQAIELIDEGTFNPNTEYSIFGFLMMLFTGIAYFIMALVFILRIVILWALMIVSPVLFLLAIFSVTRSYFVNWLGIYARWLLIGPLMALGLAIVVGIWESVGLPITSSYTSADQFGLLTNIGFYLPGSSTINTLSNTPQMMEYLLFLIMLYLPILFSFMLTRQKLWSKVATAVIEENNLEENEKVVQETITETEIKKENNAIFEAKSLVGGIKSLFGSRITELSKATVPESMKSAAPKSPPLQYLELKSSLLPQHLALSSTHDILGSIAGEASGSRHVQDKAIEKLSSPESVTNRVERDRVIAVRDEIEKRAMRGDSDAINIIDSIRETVMNPVVKPVVNPIVGDKNPVEIKVEERVVKDMKKSEQLKTMSKKQKTKEKSAKDPKTQNAKKGKKKKHRRHN